MIFGGAGVSNTIGNRILNITGGTINYSILGGSNAYETGNANNPYGRIDGETLLYVGGSVYVGAQSSGTLYNITPGNVFDCSILYNIFFCYVKAAFTCFSNSMLNAYRSQKLNYKSSRGYN